MKKVIRMENLDCASCAAKMEDAIRHLPGVTNANVNFLSQKMTIEAESITKELLKKAAEICRKVEPDCELVI